MANEMSKSIKDFDVPSALLPEKLRKDGKLWLSVPEFIQSLDNRNPSKTFDQADYVNLWELAVEETRLTLGQQGFKPSGVDNAIYRGWDEIATHFGVPNPESSRDKGFRPELPSSPRPHVPASRGLGLNDDGSTLGAGSSDKIDQSSGIFKKGNMKRARSIFGTTGTSDGSDASTNDNNPSTRTRAPAPTPNDTKATTPVSVGGLETGDEESGEAESEVAESGEEDDDEGESDESEPGSEDDTLYCICQQVAHGDMVACENTACIYEWFHFACVGLTRVPTGKWYCPECDPRPPKKKQKTAAKKKAGPK